MKFFVSLSIIFLAFSYNARADIPLPSVLTKEYYLYLLLDEALKADNSCTNDSDCVAVTTDGCPNFFGVTSKNNINLDLARSHAQQIAKEKKEWAQRYKMGMDCQSVNPNPICRAGQCMSTAKAAGIQLQNLINNNPAFGGIPHGESMKDINIIKDNIPVKAKFFFSAVSSSSLASLIVDFGDGEKSEVDLTGSKACDERDCVFFMSGQSAHTYDTPGTFEAKILDKNNGRILAVRQVEAHDDDKWNFKADVSQGTAPLDVTFKVFNGLNMTFTIDFGDGESQTVIGSHVGNVYDMSKGTNRFDDVKYTYKNPGNFVATIRWGTDKQNGFDHVQIRVFS